jgi:hypothetical protein
MASMSLLLCVIALVLWPESLYGGWLSIRRLNISYNVISEDGNLILQRANQQFYLAPNRWTFVHGSGCGGMHYGPTQPTSTWDDFGIVDTLILIPWDITPGPVPQTTVLQSTVATGHSISLPDWLLVGITGCLPLWWITQFVRRRRDQRLRGFNVIPLTTLDQDK